MSLRWASVATSKLVPRHAQNFSDAAVLQHHWGYEDRALPCTSGAATCAYLDLVYSAHDRSMIYVGVFWLILFAILLIWGVVRWCRMPQNSLLAASASSSAELNAHDASMPVAPQSTLQRVGSATAAAFRSYLLPNCKHTYFFNRITRAQVVVLGMLAAYMLVFSFVGITYRSWSVPVKNNTKNTIRSSLGPFSDRVGVLAFALTPLSILLASRESLLSVLTGLPYHHFNFLHRWVGHIIFVQSAIHTIGWCVIEIRLYQPQPAKALQLVTDTYLICGIVAMVALLALWMLSTPLCRRWFGYEFFRKAHYVLAMVFIGACWAHWAKLKVFLLPSLLLWGADRVLRLLRSACIHYGVLSDGTLGFRIIRSSYRVFDDAQHGDVVRLDFDVPRSVADWKVGQHFFLTFTHTSVWQSHPFTPLSAPLEHNANMTHSYLIRAKSGDTNKLALALANPKSPSTSTGVILSGPYGNHMLASCQHSLTNILCISGGTGITFTLPILTMLASQPHNADRNIQLIWAVKRQHDILWIQQELLCLLGRDANISIRIFVTENHQANHIHSDHESCSSSEKNSTSAVSTSIDASLVKLIAGFGRPELAQLVPEFVHHTSFGRSSVFVSGPHSMTSQTRSLVANANNAKQVFNGNQMYDVQLVTDERFD